MADKIRYRSEPEPKTEKQLLKIIHSLTETDHDYNTSAEALVTASLATFNYIAHKLGNSGFQAGWAALELFGRITLTEPPYGVVRGDDLLYPQYDLRRKLDEWITEWKPALAPKARKLLAEAHPGLVAPEVRRRWQEASTWDRKVHYRDTYY